MLCLYRVNFRSSENHCKLNETKIFGLIGSVHFHVTFGFCLNKSCCVSGQVESCFWSGLILSLLSKCAKTYKSISYGVGLERGRNL